MKWMRERDALIAQTRAFVQSVTGRKNFAGQPPPLPVSEKAKTEANPAETPPPSSAVIAEPSEAPRPIVPTAFQSEIKARVASFRAHQERFNREREEYFSATVARMRASIKDAPPRRPDK